MEIAHKFAAVAAVAATMLGAAVTHALRAEQAKTPPPAYIIAEVEPDPSRPQDPAASRRYAEEAPKSLLAFGGRYVVRGGKAEALEGDAPKGYIVVIGFDSLERARAWYSSAAYEALKPIRQRTTKSRLLLVEGAPAP